MKEFRFIHCNECNMEYEILWDNDNFEEPTKCAGCGKDDIGITYNEQKQKIIKLYDNMRNNHIESDDLTDSRAYRMYIKGMKDTLRVFGIDIEEIKKDKS